RPEDDPLGQFTPYLTTTGNSVYILIPQAGVLQSYVDAPYNCRVLVFTDVGVRLLDLGQFKQVTQQQLDAIFKSVLLNLNCSGANSRMMVQGRWDIHWLIDPGPQSQPAHLWNIFVSKSWWRVFRSAHVAHLGHGEGQER